MAVAGKYRRYKASESPMIVSSLSDLYFVDPQWLCSMLAKVVTVQERNRYQKEWYVTHIHVTLVFYG